MTIALLLAVLSIFVIILIVAVSSKKEEVRIAKLLFVLVSLYIWFRFTKVYSNDVYNLITSYNNFSQTVEFSFFFVGIIIAFFIDIIGTIFIVFSLIIIFIFSQLLFTYIDLAFNYKLFDIDIEYNVLYVVSSFFVGAVSYYIAKVIAKDKS